MDSKINVDINSAKLIYNRYKEFVVPVIVIIVSFFIFISVVMPQIKDLGRRKAESKDASAKLSILKKNLDLLSGINESTMDSQLQTVTSALPLNKDFGSVLDRVSAASGKAGVSLGNFAFQVGDLSKTTTDNTGFPSLKLDLNVEGNVRAISNFINELDKSLPLSEVTSVEISNNLSRLTVIFYYKPFISGSNSTTSMISPFTQQTLSLIDKISTFNNSLSSPIPSLPSSSGKNTTNPF